MITQYACDFSGDPDPNMLVIFQWIRTSIAKKPYNFVIFQWGVQTSCPPYGSAQELDLMTVDFINRESSMSAHILLNLLNVLREIR